MDLPESLSYKDLEKIYSKYFSFGYLNTDFNTKVALMSMVNHIVKTLQEKKPDVTHYQILKKCGEGIPEDIIKGMAVVCNDLSYQCTEYPTFGLDNKQMIAKIKEILDLYVPF